jgi:hypothetical protein
LPEGGDFSRLLAKSAEPWRSKSFNVQSWSAGRLRYFVVSDAAPEEVSGLAELFQQPIR